ncbi:DUF58 domain-containing protein [Myxococcota bacterium]|nr:DUF58 domain-containing protein [Myxococcota bacterium]
MSTKASHALLRKLEWRVRDAADVLVGGDYRSAFRGRGREFDQVVKYEYGDDVRDIDWNVTARLGEPYRKKFIEERELTVILLLEDSTSLQFGSTGRTKREALLEMAGLFALISAGNRDRVGFWHATPEGTHFKRPQKGRNAILKTTANLVGSAPPGLETPGGVTIDWQHLYRAFPRHSVLLWLGDFPPRPFPPGWNALRQRYELIGVRVEDPWERELPRMGSFAAVDPTTGQLVPFDTLSRNTRKRQAEWVKNRDLAWRQLIPDGNQRLAVSVDDDLLDSLVRFFHRRMRRTKL